MVDGGLRENGAEFAVGAVDGVFPVGCIPGDGVEDAGLVVGDGGFGVLDADFAVARLDEVEREVLLALLFLKPGCRACGGFSMESNFYFLKKQIQTMRPALHATAGIEPAAVKNPFVSPKHDFFTSTIVILNPLET